MKLILIPWKRAVKRVKSIGLLIVFVISVTQISANEKECYVVYNDSVIVQVNEPKNTMVIEKLIVNLEAIGGKVPYVLKTPYSLPITLFRKSNEETTHIASNIKNNSGVKFSLELTRDYETDDKIASSKIEIQDANNYIYFYVFDMDVNDTKCKKSKII